MRLRLSDAYLLLIRLLLGYVFASAGLCKLTGGHFGQLIGPPTPKMMEGTGIDAIWEFLAVSQVLVGALVLSGRWALLGLVALLPLNLTILAYTIANHWMGTPFVNGFFLVLNLAALLAEWPTLRFFFQPERAAAPTRLVQLWPGWRLPTLTLGALAGAALAGLTGHGLTATALGLTGIAAAWLHAAQSPYVDWLLRVVVTSTGAAVFALAAADLLGRSLIAPIMLGGLVAGLAGSAALAGRAGYGWWQARRRVTV